MNRRQLNVFVVPGMNGDRFFQNKRIVRDQNEADVVVFTGGADINPEIYGKQAHPSTYFSDYRDAYEIEAFRKMRKDQLAVGLCRGLTKAHVKQGELSGTLKCQPAAKPGEETHQKVQRLGIETKFLPMRKYVSNIPKSALTVKMI